MSSRTERTRRVEYPYVRCGIAAGVVGAAIVAGFFFAIDLLAGRPLATPTALGATLFLGEPFDLTRSADLLLIVGYTAVHGGIFVAIATIAAGIGLGRRTRPATGPGAVVGIALALFAGMMVVSLGFRLHSGVSLWNELGMLLVGTANLIAAAGMAVLLAYSFRKEWRPAPADSSRQRRPRLQRARSTPRS